MQLCFSSKMHQLYQMFTVFPSNFYSSGFGLEIHTYHQQIFSLVYLEFIFQFIALFVYFYNFLTRVCVCTLMRAHVCVLWLG